MKHSCANVFCRRDGERSGPVKNGELTVCVSTRALAIDPVAAAMYDGAALLLLRS